MSRGVATEVDADHTPIATAASAIVLHTDGTTIN